MIAVHAGAGYHSPSLEAAYKRDLAAACRAGAAALTAGGDALAAVTAAITVLETSEHCNAGAGSNLSFRGVVECDASVMEGDGTFGAVAAAPGIQHPVEAAALLARESRQPLSNGRVRPMILAGDRAREWAVARGLPAAATLEEAGAMHLTQHTQRQWRKYRRIVDDCSGSNGGNGGSSKGGRGSGQGQQPAGDSAQQQKAGGGAQHAEHEEHGEHAQQQCQQQQGVGCVPAAKRSRQSGAGDRGHQLSAPLAGAQNPSKQQQHQHRRLQPAVEAGSGAGQEAGAEAEALECQLEGEQQDACCRYDTVGCVVLAPDGRVAAGVSSGGIVLKTEGRVGEAAVFGAGCWAQQEPGEQSGPQVAVACSVTGVGERVIRHLLARECCQAAAAAASAAAAAGAAPPPADGAGSGAGEQVEIHLVQVAAELLQRTVLRGPAPHDCGLLCLKAQLLEDDRVGSRGQEEDEEEEAGMAEQAAQAERDGSSQHVQPGEQQQQQAPDSSSLPSLNGDSGSKASQAPPQQQQGWQQQRRCAVEVVVAHSAQSMAVGHLRCSCAPGTAGDPSSGTAAAVPAAAAAPAVCILRRQATCTGRPPPEVQTYVHGLTLRL